jgi:hypothetical protein
MIINLPVSLYPKGRACRWRSLGNPVSQKRGGVILKIWTLLSPFSLTMKKFWYIFLMCFPNILMAGEPNVVAKNEIAHLFDYLRNSNCEFNRNDSWYKAEKAVAHLNMKYKYLLTFGLISSAEEFIEKAATRSSRSGKPYLVRCGTGRIVTINFWFKEELTKYRRNYENRDTP